LKVVYRGKDVVDTNEMKTFEDFPDLDKTIAENLRRMKFNLMTPIQKAVMPYIIKGNDVMGCSHTGSGKTVAFLLPIITKMIREGPPSEEQDNGIARPVTLILIPTRELADQIYKEARKLVHKTGITVVKIYGGVGQYNQIKDLSYGCDILVATPGRLIDFIKSRRVSFNLVKYLIIDEADRLLDMGFEPQLNNIVFDYDLRSKDKRLNLMFSATLEDDVKTIARKFMNEYYFIHTNTEVKASQNVTQMILYAKEEEKIIQLHQFLQKIKGSIISKINIFNSIILVFLDTKRGVENLNHFLEKSNYNVIAIHGDKKQFQRQAAIQKFTNGEVPILIATDVASRGLDFPKVSYVFNYDMPSNIDAYIHRIGRTGRCGDKGVAVSFINDNNKNIVKSLFNLLKSQNQEIPEWFERMYKNLGNLSTSGKSYNSNNRYKDERDHNYLNRKRHDNFNYSNEQKNSHYSNTYSNWGRPSSEKNEKQNEASNGVSSDRPQYDYNKYLSMNNYTAYPQVNMAKPNILPSNASNNFPSAIQNSNFLPQQPINTNTFPPLYQNHLYTNYLPKFTYGNVGYYPNSNYDNKNLTPNEVNSQRNPEYAQNHNSYSLTPKFNSNPNETHENSRRQESSSRNDINSNQNEWLDLKEYSDKNSSRDKDRRRERDYNDRERERNRDNRSSRDHDYDRRSRHDDRYYK